MATIPTPQTRIAFLEAVLEQGLSITEATRARGVAQAVGSRWLQAHHAGTYTLESMRAGRLSLQVSPSISPIDVALARLCQRGDARSPELLLLRTAPYVLHPDAPLDHLAAWVRFYYREVA